MGITRLKRNTKLWNWDRSYSKVKYYYTGQYKLSTAIFRRWMTDSFPHHNLEGQRPFRQLRAKKRAELLLLAVHTGTFAINLSATLTSVATPPVMTVTYHNTGYCSIHGCAWQFPIITSLRCQLRPHRSSIDQVSFAAVNAFQARVSRNCRVVERSTGDKFTPGDSSRLIMNVYAPEDCICGSHFLVTRMLMPSVL